MAVHNSPSRVPLAQHRRQGDSPTKPKDSPTRPVAALSDVSSYRPATTPNFLSGDFTFTYPPLSLSLSPVPLRTIAARLPIETDKGNDSRRPDSSTASKKPRLSITTGMAESSSGSSSSLSSPSVSTPPSTPSPVGIPESQIVDRQHLERMELVEEDISDPGHGVLLPSSDAARYLTVEGDEIFIEPVADSTDIRVWFNRDEHILTVDLFSALISSQGTVLGIGSTLIEDSRDVAFDPRLVIKESALMKGRFGTLDGPRYKDFPLSNFHSPQHNTDETSPVTTSNLAISKMLYMEHLYLDFSECDR